MNWNCIVLGASLYGASYFAFRAIQVLRSREFKRDLERLREQRRLRKACRRS